MTALKVTTFCSIISSTCELGNYYRPCMITTKKRQYSFAVYDDKSADELIQAWHPINSHANYFASVLFKKSM